MLFNSIEFVFFFLIVLVSLIIFRQSKIQHLILLFASYFFFYYTSNYLVILLISSTLLDFYIAKVIWQTNNIKTKKLLLIISLGANLGLLGFFKYADFMIEQVNFLSVNLGLPSIPYLNLILPIAISFYTFQTISYTVDVYRGKLEPSKSLLEFALFVAFFPQLVAGPILRASQFLPQLREKMKNNDLLQLRRIKIESRNLRLGITLMVFGFFKKIFIADNISPFVDQVFSNPIGSESFTIILGTLAFGVQIYSDFSGYSDIAIGVALIMGFKIPLNFNKPYIATSPAEFWSRWHISLSTWLRDYLYIPLGGNKKSHHRTLLNLIIVMVVGGLWHGAALNFLLWGLLHGTYLITHRLISNGLKLSHKHIAKSRITKIVSIIITQFFIFLAWIPFRASNLDEALYSMQKFIFWDFQIEQTTYLLQEFTFEIIILIIFIITHIFIYYYKNPLQTIANSKNHYWVLFISVMIFLIISFFPGDPQGFIYFKF